MTQSLAEDTAAAERLLTHGAMTVEGRLVQASNATLRCDIEFEGLRAKCVYKPVAGERPLWDFPDGTLAGREVAAYLVSQAMGWRIVPPTVHRDGPWGPGMAQLWIEPDPAVDVVALSRANDAAVRRIAVFDAVINNADRKGGHVLVGPDDRIYGVDHGVSFHVEEKLRTVLWGWAGRELPPDAVEMLDGLAGQLRGPLGEELAEHLTIGELAALAERVERLRESGRFPLPPREWPAMPWPPM